MAEPVGASDLCPENVLPWVVFSGRCVLAVLAEKKPICPVMRRFRG
jgi:hypothetical protein